MDHNNSTIYRRMNFQTFWTVNNILYHTVAVSTALAIIFANSLALKYIMSQASLTRANLLLFILSISDMGVGIISIPVILLYLNMKEIPLQLFHLLLEFPYTFSWYVTILIALDRCLIVTQHKKYQSLVTRKVLLRITSFIFIIDFAVSVVVSVKKYNTLLIAIVCQLVLIFTTCCSYVYLGKYVQKNAIKMRQSSKTYKSTHKRRLTRTIFLIFLCQMIFTLPMFVSLIALMFGYTVVRLAAPWLVLLQYCNCYGNAIILLVNQRKPKKSVLPYKYTGSNRWGCTASMAATTGNKRHLKAST